MSYPLCYRGWLRRYLRGDPSTIIDIHVVVGPSGEASDRRRRRNWQDLHPREVRSLPRSYAENKFPKDYEPTVFDNLTTTLKIDNKIINLGLW